MRVLQRYLAIEVSRSVLFVMLALLALFSFIDLVGELSSLNKGGYTLQYAVMYVLLGFPGYIYEFMPIAVLIGTIVVLAQLASNSEFTIMRAASMSSLNAAAMLAKVGFALVALTFVFGEVISPYSSGLAERVKLTAIGASAGHEFRSGVWTKDLIKKDGLKGEVIGSRFLNIQKILPDRQLEGIKVFEFDNDFHLISEVSAQRANYMGDNVWRMFNGTSASFPTELVPESISSATVKSFDIRDVVSEVTPQILAALFVDPDRMSAYDLARNIQHLTDNKQDTERYKIAFWKKITYPFAVLVMMAIALPFAYMNVRSGGVSLKVFSGIMIGMGFYLVNSLFSHVGLLNTWPALVTAAFPSVLFLIIAIVALRVVERR